MTVEHGTELFGTTYPRGDTIFRQGDPGETMYIIQSGAVEVSQHQHGTDHVIAILEKGDFFGEMALLQDDVRSATIRAIRPTRLIALTKDLLVDRLKRDPDVSLHLLRKLIERIQRAHRRFGQELRDNDAFRNAVVSHTDDLLSNRDPSGPAECVDALPDVTRFMQRLLGSRSGEKLDRHRRQAAPGEVIFREGDAGDAMYLVVSGSVGVITGDDSSARLVDTIGAGDFFGEMALITASPRSATVRALEAAELIAVDKRQFLGSLQSEPELAIAIIKTLILRFTYLERIIARPDCIQVQRRAPWMPVVKPPDRITLSIVTLSTCAGCSAVLLDNSWLSELLSVASINYCQMLMDEEVLGDSDVILVDGLVRLREDENRLQEARRKCRHLLAWGSCAAFAGIPALANRFEVEAVIEESFGATNDAFSYYFSGASGIDRAHTYQRRGIALQRRAFALDSFVKVDYYLPGCPPPPAVLLNVLHELTHRPTSKTPPIVCSRCGREPLKGQAETAAVSNGMQASRYCFNSLGRLCLGFMTRGGCDPVCPRWGAPCWGCRGPSNKTVNAIQAGATMEDIAAEGLSRRCREPSVRPREVIKQTKLEGHFMFTVGSDDVDKLTRVR